MTIICGHYGSGKTNLTINLAIEAAKAGQSTTVLDMDVVNPYFRVSDYGELLAENGVTQIKPNFAGTTLDTPSLPPQMYAAANQAGELFMDVGGDDVGATALGSMKDRLASQNLQIIYVINHYRNLSQTAQEAAILLREIETISGLKATGIVNNSHLGAETTVQAVLDSLAFAEETAARCRLPLQYTTIPDFAVGADAGQLRYTNHKIKMIKRYVLFPWETNPAPEKESGHPI